MPYSTLTNQDAGDIFTVRVAGNVVSADVLASVEYAVKNCGSRVIVVLGHTQCGAVAAARGDPGNLDGHIPVLVQKIWPAVAAVMGHDSSGHQLDVQDDRSDLTSEVFVEANVRLQARDMRDCLTSLMKNPEYAALQIVGAVFDVQTGVVRWLEG